MTPVQTHDAHGPVGVPDLISQSVPQITHYHIATEHGY